MEWKVKQTNLLPRQMLSIFLVELANVYEGLTFEIRELDFARGAAGREIP